MSSTADPDERRTVTLATDAAYESPSGASEIRLLLQRRNGEITHATCPAGKVAQAATVGPLAEMYYVIAGRGRLWRRASGYEGVTRLAPGRWAAMPPGTKFQYRAESDSDLVFLVVVTPKWSADHHQLVEDGRWSNTDSADELEPGPDPDPWQEGALPAAADYFAPDGSEIRLLADLDVASVAHCALHSGRATAAVRHRTVHEIWFVLGGHGALWRKPRQSEGWVTPLRYGVCVDIEAGEAFQFRSTGLEPLTLLILTMPSWPGPDEADHAASDARWI